MKKAERGVCYGGIFSLTTLTTSIFLCFLQPSTAFINLTFEKFTLFALTQKSTHNNTIHFDLKLRNHDINPIYYDALKITFYYKTKLTQFSIGNVTFDPFFQTIYGDDHRVGNFEATGVKWESVTVPQVTFRVEVATSLTFGLKVPSSRTMTKGSSSGGSSSGGSSSGGSSSRGSSTKIRSPSPHIKPKRKPKSKRRQRYAVVADLKVNDRDNLVNKGVKLKSRARRNIKDRFKMVGMLLGILFFLNSW